MAELLRKGNGNGMSIDAALSELPTTPTLKE